MSNVPEELHYSKDHEWIRIKGSVSTISDLKSQIKNQKSKIR